MRPTAVAREPEDMSGGNTDTGGNTEEKNVGAAQEKGDRKNDIDGEQEKSNQEEIELEAGEAENTKKEKGSDKDQPNKSQQGFVTASAIYMPYLCFSTQCRANINLEENKKFKEAKTNYDRLLDAYEDSVIHGSPTLDEWYYHFATDKNSIEDKDRRNENQVVTKFLQRDMSKSGNPSRWRLLRVNQLWAWTIEDKWLITANSCPLDDSHHALVEGMLKELSKQAESGGSGAQPKSATDMSRLIIDYCIGSYERRPKLEGEMSIGQIFSNYMNGIGRDETVLFEDFRLWTKNWQQQAQRNGEKAPAKSCFPDKESNKASFEVSFDKEIRNAIKRAEKLYCDIKDVRDELNILKSVARYQGIVQRELAGKREKEAELSASYVVNDIKEMDIVANRIQSAVNTTLSLQQSEIANFQAALAATQASLATDQGKILMAFTFATLLFLPLSFLSSLLALDVNSFQQTPGWAFAVIFLVAVAVSIILGFCAIYWDDIKKLGKRVLNVGEKPSKYDSSSPRDDTVGKAESNGTGGGTDSRHQRPYPHFRAHTQREPQGSAV